MTTDVAPSPAENALDFISRPTPQLRDAAAEFAAKLPPAEFAELLGVIRSAFDKYTAKLLEFRPGIDRAGALHRMMDRELQAAANVPVSCRQGCSGCCSYEVEITEDEAEILKAIVQNGFPIDQERLAVQAARERKSPEWRRFGAPVNRCVFLGGDGACQIYEDRPAICRKHLVVTPASACVTPGAAVAPVKMLLAEILLSATTSLEGAKTGSLPLMLRTALQSDTRRASPTRRSPPGESSPLGPAFPGAGLPTTRGLAGERQDAPGAERSLPEVLAERVQGQFLDR